MNDEPRPRPSATNLRHRLVGLRGVSAVALASVILGGLGGAVLGTVSQGDDQQAGRTGGGGAGPGQRPIDGGFVPPGRLPGPATN